MVKHFPLPKKLVDRESYILEACRDKAVLHLGCADFASEGDWERTVTSDRWLHKRIAAVARSVTGIDNAEAAVHVLRTKYGYTDIVAGSAEDLDTRDIGAFDVIVAGELIEHLQNPGLFLTQIARRIRPDAVLIVTTANAFCARRFARIAFGAESIHVDHAAYYSHRTLARLAEGCGLRVVEQASYRLPNKRPLAPYLFERAASLLSPNLCEGIVATFARA